MKINMLIDSCSPARRLIAVFVVLFCCVSITRVTAIEVVEGEPDVVTESGRTYSTSQDGASNDISAREYRSGVSASQGLPRSSSGELFAKIQALEVEVRDLRGLVEQQTFLIDQLSQRRMDDYLDLDRRIGELQRGVSGNVSDTSTRVSGGVSRSAGSPVVSPSIAVVPDQTPGSVPEPPVAKQADRAKTAYRAAYQKVKDRKFTVAKVELIAFINAYPDSQFVPNAHFWLGELFYLDSDLQKSRDSFYALVTDYSGHRKVADAKFKLGKIYHQLGDTGESRVMLQSVLTDHPNSKAANPAREYLKNSLN